MTRRPAQQPTRTAGGIYDDFREEHPAYAMIGASRVSSMPGAFLAGSDFQHQHFVKITVRKGGMTRSIGGEHWYGTGLHLIEVVLSYAQWATFLSTMNVGDGVPCTLESLTSIGEDGQYRMEEVPGIAAITDRREQLRGDVKANLDTAMQAIRDAMDAVDASSLSGKGKKELRDRLDLALRELGPNLDFTAEQFDRHAEQTVERAKIEVEAYVTGAIQRAGLQALGGTLPVLELSKGDDDVRTGE